MCKSCGSQTSRRKFGFYGSDPVVIHGGGITTRTSRPSESFTFREGEGRTQGLSPLPIRNRKDPPSRESESVRERRFRFSTVVSNTRWVGKTGGSLKASRLVEARSEAVRRR